MHKTLLAGALAVILMAPAAGHAQSVTIASPAIAPGSTYYVPPNMWTISAAVVVGSVLAVAILSPSEALLLSAGGVAGYVVGTWNAGGFVPKL